MSKNDVNININDSRISGKVVQSSATDTKEIKDLTRLLKAALTENSNKASNAIEKAVSKIIRDLIKSQPSASTLNKNDLNNVMRGVGKELGNEVVNSIIKSLPKNPGIKQDSASIERAINNSMSRAADKMAGVLASRLSSKAGVTVNTSELSKGIAGAMRSSMPSGTEKATRELLQAVGSLKNITRDVGNLVRQIGSMRQSGGKIDISEIGSVLSAIKKIANDFKVLSQESSRAKDSLQGVAIESKNLMDDLSSAIEKVKTSAGKTVSGVQQRAVGDPKAFTKEIVNTLTGVIKSSESLKGTSLEKAVRNLEGKLGDMSKLATELQKFQATLKKEASSGTIKIDGIDKIVKEFDQIVSKLGNVPKNMGIENPPKEWEDLTKALNTFTQRANKLTTQVKLIVDDSDIKKAIPSQVVVGVKPKVDKKSIEDDVDDALDKSSKKVIKPKVDKKSIEDDVDFALDKSSKKVIKPKVDTSSLKALKSEILDVIGDVLSEANKHNIKLEVEPVVKKLKLALGKDDLEGMRKSLSELSNIKIDATHLIDTHFLTNELRKAVSVLEGQAEFKISPTLDDKKSKLTARKFVDNLKKVQDGLSYPTYSPGVIKPSDRITDRAGGHGALSIKQATEQNINALSTSLHKLQEQVVNELEQQFAQSQKKWAVVKPAGGTARDAFKLTPGERQWTMQIANLDKLQKMLQNFDSSVEDLISSYKNQFVQERVTLSGGSQKQADLVGQWLKTVSADQIKAVEGLDNLIKKELSNIKMSFSGVEVSDEMRSQIRKVFGDIKLENIFKKTYAETEAKRELQREGLVKQVAIPAAKATRTGDISFQTVHGAERSLPKFAKFETGFENLYKKLTSMASGADEESRKRIFSEARGYAESIKRIGVRPGPDTLDDAEKLATNMLASVAKEISNPKAARQYIKDLYSEASKSKGFAVQELGGGSAANFQKSIEKAIEGFESLDAASQTFSNFVATMKKANLTAYDVVKSLNSLEVTNVYDVMGQVLSGNKKVSPLKSLGSRPHEERPIRDFDKAISEVEGLMPLHEQNRPRRGFHQESVVNLLSRTAPFYSDRKEDKLDTDAQKRLIKDLNLEISETLKRMSQVHGPESLPGNLKRVTSLGIPESQAGSVEEYRPYGTSNTKFLKTLNATGFKMYGEDLTTMAPFQQFQQAGRNISNVTNAMVDLSGRAELPKLRSVKERDLIESGRYGDRDRGYGYNVTAELRNTAANFEDQIVIAGKLAEALTSAVSTLVKPAPAGRVRGGTSEDRITGSGVTDIKEIKIDSQEIDKVAREYMKILGVPEEYKGRADKALIEDVRKTVAVVRGESVEVQQAKLAETFMNYFGRKLTTRYGSKGVSVTPTGDTSELAKIISDHAGAKIKLERSQTLGAAFVPKSMGKLASEIFGDNASQELKDQLIASGNKFIIDLFHKTGEGAVVIEDEAKKNAELYKKFAETWEGMEKLGAVPGLGVAGISKIKETYKNNYGDRSLTEVKPIDVRISSYGAAKRGLQTEFMESIFNNVVGAGDEGVTTMKRLDQTAYEGLLKRGGLTKYSASLGFQGVNKPEEQIASELYSKFTGKSPDTYKEALASRDEKAIIAKRAAALEAASSFYSEIIDEFGNKRTGLVGEKFLQIIEEPTENPAWTRGQIEGGEKGARLNLPAYSAYASVFGEQSNFIKEIQSSLDINAKKHWEYMKALQTMHDKDSAIYKNLTKDLKTVDISEVKKFDLSTGVYGKEHIVDEAGNKAPNPRSFSGTVMDTNKFVAAFKLAVPTGKYGPSGEIKKEEFYVPGAAARGTYPDPLLVGERGLEEITRRLSHFVNMAKELQEAMQTPDKFLDSNEIKKKIPPIVGSWVSDAWDLAKSKAPDAEAQLEGILNRMLPALSTTNAPSPSLIKTSGRTEFQYSQDFYRSQMNKVSQGSKTRPEALAATISTVSDLIIGKKEGTPEQLAAPTGLTRSLDQGIGGIFAQKLGIDVVQDTINKRVSAMNKAKIDYYNALASSATGKTGSINELLFSRKIPAVIGRATTAVVDKRDDIKKFGNRLSEIEAKYGIDLGVSAESLEEVSNKHSKAIDNYKKIGIPVLKENELGMPASIAKKIPVDFTKKFNITGDSVKGILPQKDEKVSGTLFDLMKYIEGLKKGASKEGQWRQEEISKHLEEDLAPYIESIRFPFTGTSSLAPFKPKLLDKKDYMSPDGRSLTENALMVPGVPEGMDELGPIISKLQKVLDNKATDFKDMGLMQKREELQKSGGPQSEINKLTDQIRALSAAIAEVIPKYTSQAQKLDFDGDQIEIHSAKTVKARQDIEKHYKRFHTRDETKDPYTADVFRTQFLSDANVASTGQYVLGESSAAFEKKFPAGGGFDFLKSPFLTEDLEYLSAPEALKALKTTNPNIGDIGGIIKDALVSQNKPMDQISAVMSTISKVDVTDSSEAAQNIMEAISSQHKDLLVAVEKGIKKRLYEEKLNNAVEAQLFKIHTGPDVESLYRVHRLGETATGFSGGEISGRTGKSTSYFQSRFPTDMKSYGGRPEEEFQTMLNEMVRFGIQKGMDVKHAGAKPVTRDMIDYLTRGTKGASEFWSRIQDSEDSTFSDLRDFSKANESSLKMRLGALSTPDIMSEASKIVKARGENIDVSGMDREALIKLIVDKVGFKGFLEELSSLIKEEAIKGLISQAETWSPAKKAKPGGGLPQVSGDLKSWATLAVNQQIDRGGINILQDITSAQSPLYSMRTSLASPTSEYKKYMEKFGAINVPEHSLKGLDEEDAKTYKFKYRTAVATAENIKQELRAFSGSQQGGAYADMIRGAEEALYAQLDEMEKHVTGIKKEGYNPEAAKKENLFDRVKDGKGVSGFASNVLNRKNGIPEEVSRLSDMVGIPGLDKAEAFSIKREELGKFTKSKESELKDSLFIEQKKEALMKKTKPELIKEADKFIDKDSPDAPTTTTMNKQQLVDFVSAEEFKKQVEDYANQMVEKAQALAQLDKVVDVLLSNRSERRVLTDLMPKPDQVDQYSSYDKTRADVFNRAKEKMKFEGPQADFSQADFMAFGGSRMPNQAGAGMGTGGVVPVHLVGVDPSVILNVNGLEDLGFLGKTPTAVDITNEMDKNLQKFAEDTKELGDIVKKLSLPDVGGVPISYENFYTPSRMSGGGDISGPSDRPFNEESRFKEQVERIARNMMTEYEAPDELGTILTAWGTLIHDKLEKALETRGNIKTEQYREILDPIGGLVGGTADIVEYDTADKQKIKTVADIKTVNASKLGKIKAAIEDSGSSDFSKMADKLDDHIRRQLEDNFSQLNTYLKIFDKTAQAELRFYDREGMGEDVNDYTSVKFSFDPDRFKKDMEALASARERVNQAGGRFSKTDTRNKSLSGFKAEGATPEEINRALEIAKQAHKRLEKPRNVVKDAINTIGASRGETYESRQKIRAATEKFARQEQFKGFSEDEYDKYLKIQKPVEGENAEAFLANLKILHDQSKLYQKSKGLDMDVANKMPKQVKTAIESVKESGPDYQSFIDLTGKLKDLNRPDFNGLDMIKAWKLYRMAIGDWMLNRADQAYQEMRAFEESGDEREAHQAYGDFTKRVTDAQEFVRGSLGKTTDIYTDDKRFVFPNLAQHAGVYMSPKQIMKKIGEPLGDDPQLIERFKKTIEGIHKEVGKVPPVEAARFIFEDLSDVNKEMANNLSNSERFKRLGPEILEAWDFDKLTERVTRLRAALQQVLKDNKEMNAEQRKNIENIVKYLKNVEGMYSSIGPTSSRTGYGQTGIIPVPKFETPENQKALHARNIQSVREYFRRPAEEGGPDVGERFSYSEKIVGSAGETIKNVIHNFKKYGEELLSSGQKTGLFSESQQDLIEKMQRVNASFSNAVRRVVMWGAASRLVYGGVANLKSSLNELADIEVGFAQLRMVMSPLEADFEGLSKAATGFAKQYGVPVTGVLKSMKIFAQQGLKQSEIVDRTQTATLASNVTTLDAKEATEALTSAMKIFREEGTQSMRFLDAWSEVEAKHAITAGDMANAIKKSAAAAKSAGVNFDQLNGMVAAVGAVTRQTGKEVGTSFRFIFRRLFAEEGPKNLAKMGIPTLTPEGELRGAFDILGDLAGKWKDLTTAQRMNMAQAIGGTRQYNSLLVLMDQWDEALRGIRNSTNSKGSAERRNAEIMKTYAKQLERTKAAATEFKMEIGKIALPAFTAGTKAITLMFETLTAIPAPIKAATAALAAFFTLGAKGIDIFDMIGGSISKGSSLFGELGSEFSKQMKIAKYEITGKADSTTDIFGLKTLTPTATKTANALKDADGSLTEQGSKLSDFHSSLGKMMFQFMSWGKAYNEMIGSMMTGTGALTEKVGEGAQDVGSFLSFAATGTEGVKGIKSVLQGGAAKRGLGASAVKDMLTTEGLVKGGGKLLAKAGLFATEIAGSATYIAGQGIDAVGEQLGKGGHKILKDWSTQNAGFVKSVAPLALTLVGMIPALKAGADYFSKMTGSAQDFEQSMNGVVRNNESQLKSIRDIVQEYDALNDKVKDSALAKDPAVKARRQELGTYESPLTTRQNIQSRAIELTNQLAMSNQNLVVGYDELGNAVLKAGTNFRSYLKDLENLEIQEGVATSLEILSKYLDDLSSGSKTEKTKLAFKELAEAFPVLGELASRNIKVSPAKQLEVAAEDLNKKLNLKQKYPMSTAANEDIKRLQEVLTKARDAYNETFSDMKRVYGTVLSRANLRGLTREQVTDIVKSPELRQAYEMQIKIDPRFKLVEGVTWQDIMGKELLSALNPATIGSLDVVSEFTKANLETAGVVARKGKTTSGDIITFYKDLASDYNIAGNQAIVKMKGTDEWVVEYFNTRTLQLEERPLDEVENIVENIFPLQKIKDDLSYRMDSLNTFVAGASAGLVGLSEKDFKRDFNLGERFFGEIPTNILLQGNKGFMPGTGYGEVEGMKNYKKDLKEYYFKPMEELRSKTEQFEKLKLEGLETGDITISQSFYEEINKLLDVLKNNQVVIQFRAVFVDLMKEIATGQRILKEDIAVMRRRAELNVVPSGLTRGMPIDLEGLNFGTRDIKNVTARQSLLTNDKDFREKAIRLKELELTSQNSLGMVDKFERAVVQIDDIAAEAKGFGASLTPSQLQNYVEKVVPEGDDGPFYELTKVNKSIEQNTSDTADKLDKMLENMGDPEAVEKNLSSIMDYAMIIGSKDMMAKKTVRALERVGGVRSKAEGRNDQKSVMAANEALEILSKKLVSQVGYKKGLNLVDSYFTPFSKKFKPEEFQQRAFSGVDPEVFIEKLKQKGTTKGGFLGIGSRPALVDSDVFKRFEKAQQEQVHQTAFSSKNLARVAAVTGALSLIQRSGNKKIIEGIDEQISTLDQTIANKRGAGAGGQELEDLVKNREALYLKRSEKRKEADFYGSVAAISGTGFAVTELAKAFGMTEKQVTALGISAVGTYSAMLLASKITGEDLPESAKKFGDKLEETIKKTTAGEYPGVFEARSFKKAGEEMTKDFEDKSKKIFGKSSADIAEAASKPKTDPAKLVAEIDKELEARAKSMNEYLGPSKYAESRAKYASTMEEQAKARAEILSSGKTIDSFEYKDLIKQQEAEKAEFFRGLGREEKRDIVSKYPTQQTGDLSKYISETLGKELEKTGDHLVRGLEKSEAPSKLKQAIVAYLAVGLSDYASNKTADKTAMAETEKIMKRQSEALAELIKRYPDAAEEALKELQPKPRTAFKDETGVATFDKSMVQDTAEAKEAIKKQIKELRDTYIEEQKKAIEEQRKIQNQLADRESRVTFKKQQEEAIRNRRGASDAFNINRRYSLTNTLNKGLQGFSGELELPISEEQMSTQQRVYKDADKSFKEVIDAYAGGIQQLESMRGNLERLKQASREQEDIVGTTDDDDVKRRAKERHIDLNKAMEDQITVIDALGEKLRKFGEIKALIDQFSNAIYRMRDALKEVGVQEAVERIPGMQTYREGVDKLLGGSHPDAVVPISTEQSYMASKVGIDLQHMRQTQYDVRAAELSYQISQTRDPMEAANLRRQLYAQPEQRSRDLQVYTQRQQDSRMLRAYQPYEQQVVDLERVRTSPNIKDEQAKKIEEMQRNLVKTLDAALLPISTEEAMKELEKHKGEISKKDYESEKRKIQELEGQGIFTTRKGIGPWEKQEFDEQALEIKEELQKLMKTGREGMSADLISGPIVRAIDTTNAILTLIAEKEYGIDYDSSDNKGFEKLQSFLGKFDPTGAATAGFGLVRSLEKFSEPYTQKMVSIMEKLDPTGAATAGYKTIKTASNFTGKLLNKIFGLERDRKPFEEDVEKKAIGGRVFGPGGPKEDKVPAWLSPGEYVIRAHSAQKLGPDVLDYINSKGKIPAPGYADGGIIKQWLKTAYDFWFGGDTKEDESSLRKLGKNKGMRFEGKAGSYFESAADKKKRLDEALGYAVGGYAGLKDGETYEQREQIRRKEREAAYTKKYEDAYGDSVTGISIAGSNQHTLDKSPEYLKQINSDEYQAQLAKFNAQQAEKKRAKELQIARAVETTQQVESLISAEPAPVTRGKDDLDYMNGKKVRYFTAYGNEIQEHKNNEAYRAAGEVLSQRMGISRVTSEEYREKSTPYYKGPTDLDEKAMFYMNTKTDQEGVTNTRGFSGTGEELSSEEYYNKRMSNYTGPRSTDPDARYFTDNSSWGQIKPRNQIPGLNKTEVPGATSGVLPPITDIYTDEAKAFDRLVASWGKVPRSNYVEKADENNKDSVFTLEEMLYGKNEAAKRLESFNKSRNSTDFIPYIAPGTLSTSSRPNNLSRKNQYKGTDIIDIMAPDMAPDIAPRTLSTARSKSLVGNFPLSYTQEEEQAMLARDAKRRKKLYGWLFPGSKEDKQNSLARSTVNLNQQYQKFAATANERLNKHLNLKNIQKRDSGGPIVDPENLKDEERKKNQNWAITTSKEFQDQQRAIAEGLGPAGSKTKIMGLDSPQYITEQYLKASANKNKITNQMRSYAELTTTPHKVNNEELLKNMQVVPQTRSRFIDDPKYREKIAVREKATEELYKNLFITGKGEELDFNRLPGYLPKLKKQYDYTIKALGYENITPEHKKWLEERKDNLTATMNSLSQGANMFSLETQKKALGAIYGGYGASNYNGVILLNLQHRRDEEYAKAVGDKGLNSMSAFYAAPDIFSKMMKEFREGNLTDSNRKKYQDIFRKAMSSTYYSYHPEDLDLEKSKKLFARLTGKDVFLEGVQDQVTIPLIYQELLQRLAQQGDGSSAKVYHNGGLVSKTGKIFAEKGEIVIPKAFADGGQVSAPSTTTTALATSIKLDVSDIISKLESIELKVEDKAFKLEDTNVKLDTTDLPKLEVEKPDWSVKVEEKTLKLEDNMVKLDISDLPKLEIDLSNLPSVKIDTSDLPEIKVEKPDWSVQVGTPTEPITVKVDLGDAEGRLRAAISEALSQPVRVEVDGSVNAVGGEKFDQLAQTVKSLSDRLITVKGEIDGKINMIDKGNNQTSEIDRVVSLAVSNGVSPIKQEINDLRTEIGRLGSDQRRQQTTLDARLEQMRYDLSLTQNVTGIGTGGSYGG